MLKMYGLNGGPPNDASLKLYDDSLTVYAQDKSRPFTLVDA